MKRKICVFSGKRGGFGAYLPLMQMIRADNELELQIVLGDMHAAPEFGLTVNEARSFFPDSVIALVEMGAGRGDSPRIRTENLGVCLQQTGALLEKLKPDILMVHADRAEHLVMALAGVNFNIPVSHTQGGEVSGNVDDIQRHATTKLAHLHFPETEKAAAKLKSLGEEEWRIKTVGSLYVDRVVKKMYISNSEARKKYGLGAEEKYWVVLYHPDTFEPDEDNYRSAKGILDAARFSKLRSIVAYPCSDPGHLSVIRAIEEAKEKYPELFLVHRNIDNLDFLGLLEGAVALVGNSSAALVEAPYLHLPAINVGDRQIGRDRDVNVIDCAPISFSILKLMDFILAPDPAILARLMQCGQRLGDGHASEKILNVIKTVKIDWRLLRKK